MYHFLNCLALAFAPHVIAYKATKLAEESGLRACMFAALGYAATQIVKIFVMASLLPSSGSDDLTGAASAVRDFSFLEEAAKSLISLVEVFGVQLILAHTPTLAKFSAGTRILAIALGMSFAESLLRYAIPIFWGARAAEFSWSFLEMSVSSNVNFGWAIVFVTAVWLRTRTDLSAAALPGVWAILATNAVLPSVDHFLLSAPSSLRMDSWSVLGLHAALVIVMGLLAKSLFNSYMAQRAAQAAGSSKAQ